MGDMYAAVAACSSVARRWEEGRVRDAVTVKLKVNAVSSRLSRRSSISASNIAVRRRACPSPALASVLSVPESAISRPETAYPAYPVAASLIVSTVVDSEDPRTGNGLVREGRMCGADPSARTWSRSGESGDA